MPDVVIIGGGPAGSTAAILLARAGWDVTLVEQSRFPRDKVCGECLSALGFDVLTRLGLAGEFMQRAATRLDGCEVHAPSGRSLVVELPQSVWGLSRHAFDGLLLDAARRAGATVRQPVRCELVGTEPDHRGDDLAPQVAGAAQRSPGFVLHLANDDPVLHCAPYAARHGNASSAVSRPLLRLRDLITNRVETIRPEHVILADGKAAFAVDPPSATGDFGIKTHFTDVDGPRDRIELFGVRGSYGGLAAIEGGRWNAAFSVPAARVKAARGNLDALFGELCTENATLARRLAGARRTGPWLAAPLPRFAVRTRWPPNVIPIGNAAAALEPIGGEGMGLAMRSAEVAALTLIGAADAGSLPLPAAHHLSQEYQKLWRGRRAGCRAAAVAVSSRAASALLAVGSLSGPLRRAAVGLTGKTRPGSVTRPPAGHPLAESVPETAS